MNNFQLKTAENAKKKLEILEHLKKILEAAIEGKVIRHCSGKRSDEDSINFCDTVNEYKILPDKQKVYTFYYRTNKTGRVWSYSNPDYRLYINTLDQIMSYIHDCTILKETVEEFEV